MTTRTAVAVRAKPSPETESWPNYQDKENERVRARAAKTRRSMRQYLMDPSAAETDAIAA